ncbi:hypothetical protein BCY84_16172 [Trypanosoma cruzi cruzi]|nr:hypothetical protein BCY84_16172 [Trypanosoma cruzi cruzi]
MMRTSPRSIQQPMYRGGQGGFQQQHQNYHQYQHIPGRRNSNLSPVSGGRGGNMGAPLHFDRHHTIRLVCPRSNTVVCTRLNRVLPTLAKAQSGAAVCEDFMYAQSCPYGESCTKVHVPKEHTWTYITPDINRSTGLFEPGFIVHCYGPRMTQYYPIQSEFVLNTRGSREYVKMYNEHGDNFKAKFKLCESMLTRGECSLGEACDDIHAIRNDVWNMESNTTHIAEPELLANYPRLPANITVRAFEQNSKDSFVDYPGDQVLLTLGSRQYLTAFEAEGTIPKKKMQHCAHFRTNHLCRRGESCRFLHVVTDAAGSPVNSIVGEVSPNSTSRGDSPSSDITVNPRVRHNGPWMSGSQVALMVAQRFTGATDAASPKFNQGTVVEPMLSNSGTESNNPVFMGREEHQASGEATPSILPSRMIFPNQATMDMSGKMRMISPTRRNNPYAMYHGEE